jgi:hypothetical protein
MASPPKARWRRPVVFQSPTARPAAMAPWRNARPWRRQRLVGSVVPQHRAPRAARWRAGTRRGRTSLLMWRCEAAYGGWRGCARRRATGAAARVVLRRRVAGAGVLVYTTSIAGTDMVAGSRADPQPTNHPQGHNLIQSSPISNPEQQKHSTRCLLPAPRPRRPNEPTIAASRPANQLEAAASGAG